VASLWPFTGFAKAQNFKISTRSEYWDIVYAEGGFDKKYGLEAQIIPHRTGVEVAESLIGGVVDIASIGHAPLVNLWSKSKDVIAIATSNSTEGDTYKLIVKKDSPIQSLKDLVGKRIATKIGSGSYLAFANYAKSHDYTMSDFVIVNTAPATLATALESSSTEAAIWFPPTTSIMIFKGFGRELDNFHGQVYAHAHWVVNKKFAEKHPDIVVRFLAGVLDTQDLLANKPKKAAEILSRGFKKRGQDLSPEVFLIGLEDFDFGADITTRHMENFPKIFQNLVKEGWLSPDAAPDYSSLVDTRYLEKAKELRKNP
jgi:ABC-type nitrate/sulfonate/bicarbonate transport system substrate-binding protein